MDFCCFVGLVVQDRSLYSFLFAFFPLSSPFAMKELNHKIMFGIVYE